MKTVSGIITAIEGEKFEVDSAEGKLRFSLALDAVLEAGDLPSLVRQRSEVTIHYEDIPDDRTHVAHRVFPAGKPGFLHQTR